MTIHKNQAGQPSTNGGHFAAKMNTGDVLELTDSMTVPASPADDWRTGGTSPEVEFEAEYETIDAPDGDTMWMYDDVVDQGIPVNRVWSVVEGENNSAVVCTGFHVVNMLGYIITDKPWDNEAENYIWWEANDFDDDDDDDTDYVPPFGEDYDDEYNISENEALDSESYDDEGLDEAE